ncbi:condensation domain-containing protein, partial [Ruminobacter sp.]|uniref:condensation domain-containing protein n=1 Tax=Ruminobacter sp. TaxID=2774296 RepID=UPI0038678F86
MPKKPKKLFTVKEDPDNRYEPFPLTEVQRAYWLGQVQGLPLNSRTYYLIDLEGKVLDSDRLNRAFDMLILRHEMLRSHVTDDGMQVIERKNTASSVVFTCCQTREQAKEAAKEWWNRLNQDEKNHPLAAAGFVFGDSMRLSVAFSYMNLDGFSVKLMLKELADAYTNPEEYSAKAPLSLSFRDYVLSAETDEESLASAKKYWDEKIEEMPDAPQLPLASSPDRIQNSHFIRIAHTLSRNDWSILKEKARKCGITPSAVLLQAYASTLSRYSSENSVTVNMTLFDRKPVHNEILSVAGDFTSLLPVTYRPSLTRSFSESVRDMAEELASGLDHRELSSIYIQRELSKRRGLSMASLPVIFTSTLGVGDENVSDINNEFLSIADGGMSETPQVWLDHQLYEKTEGIYLTWDYVEGLFDESLINEMFACYLDLVYRIVNSDWNEPICPALPQSAVETRNRINDTAAPITDMLIAERIFANSVANPDDTAIFYGDGEISYG